MKLQKNIIPVHQIIMFFIILAGKIKLIKKSNEIKIEFIIKNSSENIHYIFS